jgi:hypothetical protein
MTIDKGDGWMADREGMDALLSQVEIVEPVGGILEALREHGREEGRTAGLRVAEDWRDTLEDILEQGNEAERAACSLLLLQVHSYLKETV